MPDVDEQCLEESMVIQLAQGVLAGPALGRAESHLAHCEPCRTLLVLAIRTADRALRDGSTATLAQDSLAAPRALAAAEELEVPQPGTILVDKYRVEGVLGRGGMGVVLAATHLVLHSRVAIKVLRRVGASEIARFLREARVSAQLRSRHIVRVFDFGQLPSGAPFLVMEYLEGKDLARCIEHAALPVRSVVEYVAQACDALAQVHALGIVHRDLKPANLFLTQDHGELLIKVLDFGIFKTLAGAAFNVGEVSTQLTGAHALIGSPVYMSPEQLFAREVDARSDIWALGVILYELLTTELPFGHRNLSALAVAVATTEPTPPSQLQPGIPRALEAIIVRCLRKDPSERYHDAAELLAALAPLRATTLIDTPPGVRSASPRRWLLAAGLGVAALGLAWWASATPPGARDAPRSASHAARVQPLLAAPQAEPVLDSADAGRARASFRQASSLGTPTEQPRAAGMRPAAETSPGDSTPADTAAAPLRTPTAVSDPPAPRSQSHPRQRTRARAKAVEAKPARSGPGPTDTPD